MSHIMMLKSYTLPGIDLDSCSWLLLPLGWEVRPVVQVPAWGQSGSMLSCCVLYCLVVIPVSRYKTLTPALLQFTFSHLVIFITIIYQSFNFFPLLPHTCIKTLKTLKHKLIYSSLKFLYWKISHPLLITL